MARRLGEYNDVDLKILENFFCEKPMFYVLAEQNGFIIRRINKRGPIIKREEEREREKTCNQPIHVCVPFFLYLNPNLLLGT